jgi:predicted nucleic acid-binding Zn ribbon protein
MDGDIPARLGDLLEPAARRAGIEDGARTGMVWNKWLSIVGPDIAQHAEPSSLRSGILRVRADSPAWATELGYLGEEIKRSTNKVVGAPLVSEVRVWTGPGPIRRAPEPPPNPASAKAQHPHRDVDPLTAFQRAFGAWRTRGRGTPHGSGTAAPRGSSAPREDS